MAHARKEELRGCLMPGIYHQAGCCCPVFGDDCQHCDAGKTPAQLSVTFSGITLCTECNDEPSTNRDWTLIDPDTDPNGTFIVTQDPENACRYEFTTEDSGYVQTHNSFSQTCDGQQFQYSLLNFFIVVRLAAGTIDVESFFRFIASPYWIFDVVNIDIATCTTTLVAESNTIDFCKFQHFAVPSVYIIGHGGNVTVVPV